MNISLRFTDKIRFTEENIYRRKYFNISNLNFESKRFVCIFLLDPKIFAGSDPDPGFENVVDPDRKPCLVVLYTNYVLYSSYFK